ncbi:MAG: glycerate kinase [Dehalococcoidia bacterium]|nr:MAG: glycerate kinase [Dehalococcoidia bacterium]
MRVLVVPQEFKGTLTAAQAADTIARGLRRAAVDTDVPVDLDLLPFADGGPGTASTISQALGGRTVRARVEGLLGAPVDASYVLVDRAEGLLAIIDSAEACGLVLIPEALRDPLAASSAGVGTLVLDAINRGAQQIVLGVGGTGTNDGGAGAAQTLGVRLLDARGESLPRGAVHLARLARIERVGWPAPIDVRIAVDVRNPLLGVEGATAVYGAQKGVSDWQAPALEAALTWWAERLRGDLSLDVASMPGAGAGGGLACGLMAAIPSARIEPGAVLVGEVVGLRARIEAADLVVTGEGMLDTQTAYGKAVAHVATLAAAAGRPCLVVAGRIEARPPSIADAEAATPGPAGFESNLHGSALAVEAAAERLFRRWLSRSEAVTGS